ncbi:MAG: MFS transporter [Phototrophicaceae bacterium]
MVLKSNNDNKERWHVPGLNRQVIIFLIYSLIFHIGLFGITDSLLNFYFLSVGYEAETIGTLQALPRLSGFLTGLPIGIFANRFGKRQIIIFSTYGIAISTVAVVLVQGLPLLMMSRFLFGFFFGAGQVVKPPYMVTLTHSDEHTAQFSYHNFISMSAVAMGSVLGGFMPLIISRIFSIHSIQALPAEQTSDAYRGAILLAALLILLSVIPLYRLPKDILNQKTPKKQNGKSSSDNVPWLRIIKLSIPLLIFGISGGLTFPFFNLFFRETFDIPDNIVGIILALGWLGMAIIPLLNPIWEKHVGRAKALTGLMSISAIAFFGLGVVPTLLFAVILYIFAIAIRNTMQPLYQPLLMDSLPSNLHNLASSVGLVLWNLGWFASTMSFGILQGQIGYSGIMILVAIFVLLNGLSIFVAFKRSSGFGSVAKN